MLHDPICSRGKQPRIGDKCITVIRSNARTHSLTHSLAPSRVYLAFVIRDIIIISGGWVSVLIVVRYMLVRVCLSIYLSVYLSIASG